MDNNTLTAHLQVAATRSGARGLRARRGLGQNGQNLRPFFRDGDCVLDVCRGLAIERDVRPAVGKVFRPVRAEVEHRLDGEDVARTDFDARAGLSVVRDLRVFVHFPTDAVADVVAYHPVAA